MAAEIDTSDPRQNAQTIGQRDAFGPPVWGGGKSARGFSGLVEGSTGARKLW